MDTLNPKQRGERMSRIRSKDTKPEMAVRRLVFSMGYRYRLHDRTLPGTPDLVFRGRRKAMFVHGCFWHRHPGCGLARMPKSRLDFWGPKLEANARRDGECLAALRELGWETLVVWECETKDAERLRKTIRRFLDG
ncbi:MAG: DNA mismatch endonuclease Vsr [Pseudomonadota bacterium]